MVDAEPSQQRQKMSNWALAEAFYEKELLPKLLATAKGQILVLDIESGDYAVGANLLEADVRLPAENDTPGHAFESRLPHRLSGQWATLGGRMRRNRTHDCTGVRQRTAMRR